jgi:glucose-6-phosphate isomerase
MTALSDIAGLDVQWSGDGTLAFSPDLVVDEVFSRPLSRLSPLALQPEACEPADQIQYWMYNGIANKGDRERLAQTGMHYELTLMFPNAIGRERAKTLGHLHSFPKGSAINYPEVCEVLTGEAYFIFQTMDTATRSSTYCGYLEAHPGDKIVIPPNLHHLTINAGDTPLLFSDVIPLDVKGIYDPLKDMHGAAYFNTLDAGWIANPHYQHVPELTVLNKHVYPQFDLTPDIPLFKVFTQTPEKLMWMVEPARFSTLFPDLWDVVNTANAV